VAGGDAPPPANRWAERDPVAARRLARVRAVVADLSEQLQVPAENLVQPDAVRRLAWQPPTPPDDVEQVRAALRAAGARAWQVGLVADGLAAALAEPAAEPEPAAVPEPEPEPEPADPTGA
jgi:ribonuclease D